MMVATDRGQLDRGRIAEAALALIDSEGLEGLSMRKLGAVLGVEAMSLYHYVANKDDLLSEVMNLLYSEVDVPAVSGRDDWEAGTRAGLRSFHQVLSTHPAAVVLFPQRPATSIEAFNVLHRGYRNLRTVGLSPAQAHSALYFAIAYVVGQAAEALGALDNDRAVDFLAPAAIEDPEIADFVTASRQSTSESVFEDGLELIICALKSRFDLP